MDIPLKSRKSPSNDVQGTAQSTLHLPKLLVWNVPGKETPALLSSFSSVLCRPRLVAGDTVRRTEIPEAWNKRTYNTQLSKGK